MKNRKGYSLVEIMISILVVGILFISGLLIFYQGVQVQIMAEDQASANNLARKAIEEVKTYKWNVIPIDNTGAGYLDPPTNSKPNSYTTNDNSLRLERTVTVPELGIKRVTGNVWRIDVTGDPGQQENPTVTLVTDIYKFGM